MESKSGSWNNSKTELRDQTQDVSTMGRKHLKESVHLGAPSQQSSFPSSEKSWTILFVYSTHLQLGPDTTRSLIFTRTL